MRQASVFFKKIWAGTLTEHDDKVHFEFAYQPDYKGPPISLSMPLKQQLYQYKTCPPFFDGLLPEGPQLEALLRHNKIDRTDYFSQLILVGSDLVGAVSVISQK